MSPKTLRAIAFCILALPGVCPASSVLLTGKKWTVEIDTATLAAIGRLENGARVPVSAAQPDLGVAANLKSETDRASWDLRAGQIQISARIEQDRLLVDIVSKQPGMFTWPVIQPAPALRAFMIPFGDGYYVPVNEKSWRDFVIGKSPVRTMDGLSMPLWGVDYGDHSLTYILTNPLDNAIAFEQQGDALGMRLTHEFQRNYSSLRYGLMIAPGPPSPIEPARVFRRWLIETGQFVSLRQKLEKTPELEKLFGAAHVYLWSSGVMDAGDVRSWPDLLAALRKPGNDRAARVVSLLAPGVRAAVREQFVSRYLKNQVIAGLNDVIRKRDSEQAGLSDAEVVKQNGRSLNFAFPHMLADSSEFGGGISPKMIHRFEEAGFDRLWLGVSGVAHLLPDTVSAAKQAGYLFAPYDSYHSIHPVGAGDTWATAQFDQELYEKGAIIGADGRRDHGFRGVGAHLSSLAAQPYFQKRVAAAMKVFAFNSYFIDCDATGELFDNYSPLYPATKELDMELRLERLAWIRDTYKAVIGSEGGASFAASTIHFAHGMLTPLFGFRDPALHDPKSPKFLGRWYPEGGPDVFFKETVLPAAYKDTYYDPKRRLPLYQAAFHDSIIATHHWSDPSLKFSNAKLENELLELLYGVPPLYHLNLAEFAKRGQELRKHYSFFSPAYRKLAAEPLTDFSWLTEDHLIQKTEFGAEAAVVANFSRRAYVYEGRTAPAFGVLIVWKKTGSATAYTSQYAPAL